MSSFISPAPQGTETRTDQGVDWANVRGNIVAVASGTIVNIYRGLAGFGTTIIERLSSGQEVYYAEETGGGTPTVRVGQRVTQGQALAPGTGGVIEAGFWDPSTGRSAGAPGYHEGLATASGQSFRSRIAGKLSWKPCLLTWYDPALGGTNSASGRADPHSGTASGEPYDPNKDTCAAPPQYPFGTIITFQYQGKQVTCKVNDRGGAIVGSHFDLSRHAAQVLGIVNAGSVMAQFVVGTAGSDTGGAFGGTRPGGGNPSNVNQVLQDYVTLRDTSRTPPPGTKNPFQWWLASFTGNWDQVNNPPSGS